MLLKITNHKLNIVIINFKTKFTFCKIVFV